MSTNYSKIHVKSGKIEITIEGDDNFVSEQYREIFNLPNVPSTAQDNESLYDTGKTEEVPEAQKESSATYKKGEKKAQPSKPKTTKTSKEPAPSAKSEESRSSKSLYEILGSDFGKWLSYLPKNVETRDKILVAAYYNQIMNPDQKFHLRGIRTIFKEHDISISSLPGFIDTFEIQKIIKKVAASSRKGYQFTEEGKKYVEDLLASQVNISA
jgi:hypothetical protein